ncbi:hypothetical protein CFO_g2488 [Ceratocystis platani]|uniref:Uncharacterized protein n=1 Tax=Ceratocystis fimbriata f. sp. platani TaxID=88771 RepID=A0A0F8CWY3_CERFI|nr:hypothetical protein CFO_g2488 [Ceratocystis platani]
MDVKVNMSFEEYNNSNAEPESQLRANMELLQSLAQGAQPEDQSNSNSNSSSNSNNSQQQQQQQASSPSLSNIAAQASRAAALASQYLSHLSLRQFPRQH